jgi:Histidinol dehydrogenase
LNPLLFLAVEVAESPFPPCFSLLPGFSIYFRVATNVHYRYIPGGRYPLLASAHMTILTAKVAGVPNVIGCTPPIGSKIPNATVAAMHFAGADEIFILGGVQGQRTSP